MGFPADPGLMGRATGDCMLGEVCMAIWAESARPVMGEPDSEDHQLSITWAPGAAYLERRS